MKASHETKKPATGSFLEAALASVIGYDGIQSANEAWKSYRDRKEVQKSEREEKRRLKRQKDEHRKVAAMLAGVWALMEFIAGRLIGDFRDMSPGVLRVICQTLKMQSTENAQSLPDAMPFPSEKLLSCAAGLSVDDRETVLAICAAMSIRPPSNRKASIKREDWLRAPAQKIVDLSLLSPDEAEKRAENLARAIEKYLQRESFFPVEDDTEEVTRFVAEYLALVRTTSSKLAGSFNKLAQAYFSGKVEATVFEGYLLQVPVLPPDEMRFLFRKKIVWVTEHDAS